MILPTKIDKKVLVILIVALVLVLLIGFAAYKYLTESASSVQNSVGGANTENQNPADSGKNQPENIPSVQVQLQAAGGAEEDDGFSVCLDKCGDGQCQASDPGCDKKNNMNCICSETKEECPQDCK
jgi:hypothetical protein